MNFLNDRAKMAEENWTNDDIRQAASTWHDASRKANYQYMFQSFGLPIIQDPQDICMLQEVIWRIKPTLIIETGIARGGSLALSAGILSTLAYADILAGDTSPKARRVVGIDIDIRPHNREALENHPLTKMITLIEGSSIDGDIARQVKSHVKPDDRVMVVLDSNHTEDHVLDELALYHDVVSSGSALLVMDTGIEFAPEDSFNVTRPWAPGSNPYTALHKFLKTDAGQDFSIDHSIEKRHLISCAPDGLLIKS